MQLHAVFPTSVLFINAIHWEHGGTNRFIQMKTLRFIGMAIIAVIMSVNFMACSDDDEEDKQSNTVIGTWQVTASTYNEEIGDTYTFYSDGKGLLEWEDNDGNDSGTFKYKVNSDYTTISIDYEDGDGYEEIRMSITDNALMQWTYADEEDYKMTLKRIK